MVLNLKEEERTYVWNALSDKYNGDKKALELLKKENASPRLIRQFERQIAMGDELLTRFT